MPRHERPTVPPAFEPMIGSFGRSLRADGRSARTIEMYTDAVRWFAGWLSPDVTGWPGATYLHLRDFFAELVELGYSEGYRNNIGRCLQAFDKWYAAEEDRPRLFDGAKLRVPRPPRLDKNPPPVIPVEDVAAILRDAEAGKSFQDRRDAALLRFFASTGCRLAEVAGLTLDDVDLDRREARVVGKGDRARVVRFDDRTTRALDRYLRVRATHPGATRTRALWLGFRRRKDGGAMTADGVYQVVERRAARLGFDHYPHLWRHTFVDRWLGAGGAEGDLMELAGWDSPQMLRRYGRSTRAARARRAYDRIDVTGGV